jgi:hypothetical protein
VSAEHGIGLEKRAYLPLSRTPGRNRHHALLKQALDPKGIPQSRRRYSHEQPAHLDRRKRDVTVAAMQFACSWESSATSPPPNGWCARPRSAARRSS